MKLDAFEVDLAGIIGRPCYLRPFVCEGSPLDCRVFIVGINAGTSIAEDFWTFWKSGYGFDKKRWFEAYKASRAAAPLKPGKKFRSAVTPTRMRIDKLVAAARIPILETNLYSHPTAAKNELHADQMGDRLIRFLLDAIQPKLIVAHGADAQHEIKRLNIDADILEVPHFSRGWSYEAAEKLGERISASPIH